MVKTQSGQLSSLIDRSYWEKVVIKHEYGHPLTQPKMHNSIEMFCHQDKKRQSTKNTLTRCATNLWRHLSGTINSNFIGNVSIFERIPKKH